MSRRAQLPHTGRSDPTKRRGGSNAESLRDAGAVKDRKCRENQPMFLNHIVRTAIPERP